MQKKIGSGFTDNLTVRACDFKLYKENHARCFVSKIDCTVTLFLKVFLKSVFEKKVMHKNINLGAMNKLLN